MKVAVVTIFPEMFSAITDTGMPRLALERGAVVLEMFNPRRYCADKHQTVDARPYGGGPGMVMKPEPLAKCIDAAKEAVGGPVIYLTPQGQRLNQARVAELAALPAMVLLAGRYEGIDERIVDTRVDYEISIGDYILSGGELAVMVLMDAMMRLLPGVLGNALSAAQDSFSAAGLDCPHYTRPAEFEGRRVPQVLLSGDHEKIRQWREQQARIRTAGRRPDLIADRSK